MKKTEKILNVLFEKRDANEARAPSGRTPTMRGR